MGRERRTSDRGSEPRWISQHLEGEATPSASELRERDAGAVEANAEGGGTVEVTSTRTEPGGPTTVLTTDELAAHTDDDSHVRVTIDEDGAEQAELVEVEPVEPLVRPGNEPADDAPPGSPPAPVGQTLEVDPESEVPGEVVEQRTLSATEGAPGSYSPEVHGDERPSSIAELNELVDLGDAPAWGEGSFLPYGSGKRAHWHGAGWATGESPGYTAG